MEYIKVNQTLSDSYQPGSNYIYENDLLSGPKILLAEGWSKLSEFVEILKKLKPLKPLEYNHKLCLIVPTSKTNWTNREYFMKIIAEKKEELNIKKSCFHFDIGYNDAETSAILQLVDDNTGFDGNRRKNILNPDCIQVGISNMVQGLKNCTYVFFVRTENNYTSISPSNHQNKDKEESTRMTNSGNR